MILSCGLIAVPAVAQDKPDANKCRSARQGKATRNSWWPRTLDLNEAEGKLFWPIYEAYQKDLQAINNRTGATILAYADAYNKKTLTDEMAKQLITEALTIDQDEITMRKSYEAKLSRVLPGKKVARYLQIENKIRAAIKFDLAAGIPLVP